MAECLQVWCESPILEEQQEEIIVLQSIFEDNLQIIQGGEDKVNICLNLKVKVNIPHDVIDLEAFIPVEVSGDLPRSLKSSSDSEHELEDVSAEVKVNGTSFEEHPDVPSAEVGAISRGKNNHLQVHTRTDSNADTSFTTPTKPGFSRSLSLQHWHVRANIGHLTPIYLTCTFPTLYPKESPPEFSLACLWLTKHQLQYLEQKLMQLWEEIPNLPVVYTWADWLQNYAWEYLHLDSHLVLKESGETVMLPNANKSMNSQGAENCKFNTKLETALLSIFEHDLEVQRQVFRQGRHVCQICFDERDGTEFHYFDECRHFFCRDCLKTHCDMHVNSGTVLSLLCPNHDCKTTIPVETLKQVLDKEKLKRWEHLLLNKTLDIMGDILYCPRCNIAVVADEDENLKLGHCANCFFAFCTECYEPWHHGQPCFSAESDSSDEEPVKKSRHKKSQKLKNSKEEGGDETQKERLAAISHRREQRRKREMERKIVMSNLSFIRTMKQQGVYQYCPKCHMAVERISGCDMMHCTQCRASFCWRCGNQISGYDHFSNCGRDHVAFRVPVRGPTVGETRIEDYRTANPKKLVRIKLCPRCHQKCLKENSNNNHLRCWACKTSFCYQCGKEIKGALTMHFMAASSCVQHSDD